MTITSKITERGQTTIPTKIREQLRAKPGDTLEYESTPAGVTIRVKKPDLHQVLQKYATRLKGKSTGTDIVAEQRERRGWDEYDLKLLGKSSAKDKQ